MSTTPSEAPEPRPGRLRPEKHASIMSGGRRVLAESGFEKASIDAIASASEVSTRTIYKHFPNKAALCAAIIADSATHVASEEVTKIEKHLGEATRLGEIESPLTNLAIDWLLSDTPALEHRALMDRVHSAVNELDPSVVSAWWEAGPGHVLDVLATELARWDELDLLLIPDPYVAAIHFQQLISAEPGPPGSTPTTGEVRTTWIVAGVQAFVRAYRR